MGQPGDAVVQNTIFAWGNREMLRCRNTVFALRDSRKTVSGGVQKLYFCMGQPGDAVVQNTIFALRDSRKTVSGGNFSNY